MKLLSLIPEAYLKRLRLIILLILSAYLFSRFHFEIIWFSQFGFESILLNRLSWQVIAFIVGILILRLNTNWQTNWLNTKFKSESEIKSYGFRGLLYLNILLVIYSLISVNIFLLMNYAWNSHSQLLNLTSYSTIFKQGNWLISLPIVFTTFIFHQIVRRDKWSRDVLILGNILYTISISRAWQYWALALNVTNTGIKEEFFGTDISFSLARYPAISLFIHLNILILTLLLLTTLWKKFTISKTLSDWEFEGFSSLEINKFRPITSLILLLSSIILWLSRYQFLWSQDGIVSGAGWIDTHVLIPVRSISSISLFITAIITLPVSTRFIRNKFRYLLATVLFLSTIIEALISPLIQWMIVLPRELTYEKPYIIRNIKSTRKAFQLDSISTKLLKPKGKLSKKDLDDSASTLRNIRLWDSLPLLSTNRQLQQLRVYYRFSNPSVDRYKLQSGTDERQQVIITARELDQEALPERSRTWLNKHFVFTHGYGFTMSPVNTKALDGLPEYFISDLGESTKVEGSKTLGIKRSEVLNAIPINNVGLYFGILPSPYAIAPSNLEELDYPEGDKNIYNNYSGNAGVSLNNLWRKLISAIYLFEPRILTTGAINERSRLLIRREVRERVSTVAPFIETKGDPYLVAVNVERDNNNSDFYWIVEGYTSSNTYPYAASLEDQNQLNYIRNSVKIVVNAYTGLMSFYISEPEDPIINAWSRIFPELFQPIDKLPINLRDHLKVPTELFNIQVRQLLRYHVTDPRIFYSGDDVWQVPQELYGKKQVPVEPYHVTAQLSSNSASEFLLLQPLTPLARPNLSAWLAARNDGKGYGKLVLLRFPSQTSIYGPEQIQALINQDAKISQQFSLWDRAGSEVIQGNLIVLPLGESLLYVEPVYLKASQGGLPTLTRVVVSDGKRIAMEASLSEALSALINDKSLNK